MKKYPPALSHIAIGKPPASPRRAPPCFELHLLQTSRKVDDGNVKMSRLYTSWLFHIARENHRFEDP
jgi:hypothetical protein